MQQKKVILGHSVAVLLMVGGVVAGAAGACAFDGQSPLPAIVAPTVSHVGGGQAHALADMVQAVGPSVVQIKVMKHSDVQQMAMPFGSAEDDGDGSMQDAFRHFFGFQGTLPRGQLSQAPLEGALESGLIIDRSGSC